MGYESDFVQWLGSQAEALRQRRWADVDVENLAEEVDAIGRSERREIRNRLVVLLVHLLKSELQPERSSRSWQATIRTQAREIESVLEDSPSLRPELVAMAERVYPRAREEAAQETRLPLARFATTLPASVVREVDRVLALARTGSD